MPINKSIFKLYGEATNKKITQLFYRVYKAKNLITRYTVV